LIGVILRRRANPDCIDFRVCNDIHGVRRKLLYIVLLSGYGTGQWLVKIRKLSLCHQVQEFNLSTYLSRPWIPLGSKQ
jgi:hypothetical protein